MPTSPPTITAPGAVPDPTDRATYNNRAYAFMQWMASAVAEFVAVASNVFSNATEAAQSASTSTAASLASIAASGATKWAAGSFADGVCVFSPSDYRMTFRKVGAGASAVDPATNAAGWALITYTAQVLNQVSSTSVSGAYGNDYALNNVASSEVVLPASPTAGVAPIRAIPCNGLLSNKFSRNGSLIHRQAADFIFDQPERTYSAVYINATEGWRIS